MPEQEVPILRDWVQQLSGLLVLAGCAAMATPSRKPKVTALPAVEPDKLAESKPRRKSNLSPEVWEFMHLPPHIQKQVLDYANRWIDANFERAD